jgi:hypothetical protein
MTADISRVILGFLLKTIPDTFHLLPKKRLFTLTTSVF